MAHHLQSSKAKISHMPFVCGFPLSDLIVLLLLFFLSFKGRSGRTAGCALTLLAAACIFPVTGLYFCRERCPPFFRVLSVRKLAFFVSFLEDCVCLVSRVVEGIGLFSKKGLGVLSLSPSFFSNNFKPESERRIPKKEKNKGGTYLSFPFSHFPSQLVPAARQADLQNIFSFPHSTPK